MDNANTDATQRYEEREHSQQQAQQTETLNILPSQTKSTKYLHFHRNDNLTTFDEKSTNRTLFAHVFRLLVA